MTWYYYLNYRIFKFYERKRDSMPAFFSFMATIVLVGINIFSLWALIGFFSNTVGNSISKYTGIILFVAVGVFNLLVLYRGKYYKEVFDDFDMTGDKYAHWNKTIPIYVITSIVILVVVLAIADYRFDGHL